MEIRAGSGFVLSVVVVLAAAVLLRPSRPSSEPPEPAPSEGPIPSVADLDSTPPEPTPGTAWPAEPGSPAPALDHGGLVAVVAPSSAFRSEIVAAVARRPQRSFTEAVAGERLADVARRVYGSDEAAGVLWSANRDRLDDPAGPIPAGMVLRTP